MLMFSVRLLKMRLINYFLRLSLYYCIHYWLQTSSFFILTFIFFLKRLKFNFYFLVFLFFSPVLTSTFRPNPSLVPHLSVQILAYKQKIQKHKTTLIIMVIFISSWCSFLNLNSLKKNQFGKNLKYFYYTYKSVHL